MSKMTKMLTINLAFSVYMVLSGCVPISSPQYHIDMYCGRSELKTFPMTRYWLFSWGTWENFRDNFLFVPFCIPFGAPIGISLDMLTDTILFPLDFPLVLFFGEDDEYTLTSTPESFQLSFSRQKPALAYSSNFGKDSRLFLVCVERGALEVSGMVSIKGNNPQKGNWHFTSTGVTIFGGESAKILGENHGNGSNFLIVASRDFNAIPNPFPFMHYHGGHQLYTSDLGVIPSLEQLHEALGKIVPRHQDNINYSHTHLKVFLDYFNGFNTKRTFLSVSNENGTKDVFVFRKSRDFRGTIFDLGRVSDMLNRLETDASKKYLKSIKL